MEATEAVQAGDVEASRASGVGDDGASKTPSSERRAEEEKGKEGAAEAVAAPLVAEDEQMERFYALLANIRALRGMYRDAVAVGGASGLDDEGEDGVGPSRKRARCAQPPWRPAFRIEDFEEPGDAGCSRKKQREGGVVGGGDVAKRRPGKEAAAVDEDDGEVVSGKVHRAAASSHRAGPLAS
ncbi:hypothetical protein ABZP36_029503 [Zizania latifolia]